MLNYVIGMDGGGTKTAVVVVDRKGIILENFCGGAINYNGGKRSVIDSNIQDIFQIICDKGYKKEDCSAICIGAAGISNPIVKNQIMTNINKFSYDCPISIVGDEETAFAGALEESAGILLIAGTGSICYAKDREGNTYRTGGYGHLIDDEGSGYAIAREILTAVVRAHDRRNEKTVLTELVFEYLNVNTIDELISFVYNPSRSKKEIAELSIMIEKAYEMGDEVSVRIIDKCVSGLVDLVTPMLFHFDGRVELAVSGSILLNNQEIFTKFIQKIKQSYPQISIIKPKQNASLGAVKIALEL